ncbi:hypothetical protein IAT38_005174 [Cryptococcus sp. DSM 104549]
MPPAPATRASQAHKTPATPTLTGAFQPRSNALYPVIRNLPRPGLPPPEHADTVPLAQAFILETAAKPRAARKGLMCSENPIVNFRYVEDDVSAGWYFEEFKFNKLVLTRLELCKAWALAVNGARYWEKFMDIVPTDEVMRIQRALAINEIEKLRAYQLELSIVLATLTEWQSTHHIPASWSPIADEITASPDWYLQRGSGLQPHITYHYLPSLFITIAKIVLLSDHRFERDPEWMDESLPVLEVGWYEWPKGFPVGAWETVFPKEERWRRKEEARRWGSRRAGGVVKSEKTTRTAPAQQAAPIRAPPVAAPPAKPTETTLPGFTNRPEGKRILHAYVANMAREREFQPIAQIDDVKPLPKPTRSPSTVHYTVYEGLRIISGSPLGPPLNDTDRPCQAPDPSPAPSTPRAPAPRPTKPDPSDPVLSKLQGLQIAFDRPSEAYVDEAYAKAGNGSIFSSWTARVPLPALGAPESRQSEGKGTDKMSEAQAYAAAQSPPRVRAESSRRSAARESNAYAGLAPMSLSGSMAEWVEPSTWNTRYGRDAHSSSLSYAAGSQAGASRMPKEACGEGSSLFSRSTGASATTASSALTASTSASTAPSAATAKPRGKSDKVTFRTEIPLMVELEMTVSGAVRLGVKKIGEATCEGKKEREERKKERRERREGRERRRERREGVDVTSWVGQTVHVASRG